MNRIIQLVLVSSVLMMTSCSEYVLVPQYVTVEKLNALESGMTKEAVSASLSVDPYDVYHSTENGCELYSYKYLHQFQEINSKNKHNRGALRGNTLVYDNESEAYLYFEDGKLKDLVVDRAKVNHNFVESLNESCNGPVEGCTDQEAINYDPAAVVDNETCEYCPCGYYINPNYNPKNACEEQCIPFEVEEEEEDCSICEVIKNSNGDVNISVNTTAPWGGSEAAEGKIITLPSNSQGGAPSPNAAPSGNKKVDKLQKQLAKSREKDAQTGKTSRKTLLLEKSIEKLLNK